MFRFSTLKWCANQLEHLSLLKKKQEKLDYVRSLNQSQDVMNCFYSFMLAQIGSPVINKIIVIPDDVLKKALSITYQIDVNEINQRIRMVDLSDVAEHIANQFSEKEVSLTHFFNKIEGLHSEVGYGTNAVKEIQIQELLKLCSSPIEVKYLVRFLQKKMRIGMGQSMISNLLSEQDNIKFLGYQKETSQPGTPIQPNLAKAYTKVSDLIADLDDKKRYFIEYKYDGERMQVHYFENKVELFGRSLENKSHLYPSLIQQLLQYCQQSQIQNCIIDCEMVSYLENKILPFQEMQSQPDTLSLICFDILHLNNINLMSLPLLERQQKYRSFMREVSKERIVLSHIISHPCEIPSLNQYYEEALSSKFEGIMLKEDAKYSPGLKKWYKLKPEKDADLIVIGANYGRGQRKGVYGGYLLATHQNGMIYPLTNVGTGLTFDQLQNFHHQFKQIEVPQRPDNVYPIKNEPDVWFTPKYIWELSYDVITQSPQYYVDGHSISLRFPRFKRQRDDKDIASSTDVSSLVQQMQNK